MHKPKRQSGFSLVEVLVTLVVTSVALLSSATLQLQSKRSMFDSTYIPIGNIGNGTLAAPANNCLDPLVVCTDTQMALFDLWQWEQHLDGQLEINNAGGASGGLMTATACITGPPGGPGVSGYYTVAIAWRGLADTGNPAINNCGVGAGNYGAGDVFRRVLVVQSFVSAI